MLRIGPRRFSKTVKTVTILWFGRLVEKLECSKFIMHNFLKSKKDNIIRTLKNMNTFLTIITVTMGYQTKGTHLNKSH